MKADSYERHIRGKRRIRLSQTALWWMVLWVVSVIAGWVASIAKVPAAWMIGPMVVALLVSVRVSQPLRVPNRLFLAAQAVIGLLIAGTFRTSDMPLLFHHWYAVLMVGAGTLLISVFLGHILSKFGFIDRSTALLGVLPGGASGMVAMSESMAADTKVVAVMQYMRLITVVVTASIMTKLLSGLHSTHPVVISTTTGTALLHTSWYALALSLLIGGLGAYLGLRLKIPAGAMLGSMTVGILLQISGFVSLSMPMLLTDASYAIIGVYVGLLFDRESLRHAWRIIPAILLSSLLLIVACAALGWVLDLLTPESFLTCFLATSPGGLDSVTLMALGGGANVALVVSLQTVRLFAIVFLGPVFVRRLQNH